MLRGLIMREASAAQNINMGDLELLHKAARSLILRLRAGLDKLEKAEHVRNDFELASRHREACNSDLLGRMFQ